MADSRRPGAVPIAVGSRFAAAWAAAAALVFALGALIWFWQSPAADQASSTQPAAAAAVAPALAPDRAAAAAFQTVSYRDMLFGRSADWRVMRLAENPSILVIEFPDLTSQGQAFNRLAALIEKNRAPRDRVLSDAALARFIEQAGDSTETFFFGHDYTAESVARFFTLAVDQQIRLNPAELRLGNVLLAARLLIEQRDRLVANPDRQAVISFTALQADNPATRVDETVDAKRRETILRHELSHGEFFTNPLYRDHCWAFWQALSDQDRKQMRAFLAEQGYDPKNEELMVNEAQAFLFHTPDQRAFDAEHLGVTKSRLGELRLLFNRNPPASIFASIERSNRSQTSNGGDSGLSARR